MSVRWRFAVAGVVFALAWNVVLADETGTRSAHDSIRSVPSPQNKALTAIEYGGDLKKLCESDKAVHPAEYAICWAFIAATLEVVLNEQIYGLRVCVRPPNVTVGKAVDLTMNWMKDHPDSDIKPASLVTTEALAAAFPCKGAD